MRGGGHNCSNFLVEMTEIVSPGISPGEKRILCATMAVQYTQFGGQYWERYVEMDRNFRERSDARLEEDRGRKERERRVSTEVAQISKQIVIREKMGPGDVNIALEQIQDGRRMHVYVCHEGRAFGFRRIDFDGGDVKIGALYVDERYQECLAQLGNASFGDDSARPPWQHLVRVPYLLMRSAGCLSITTVVHNSAGLAAKRWQDKHIPEWEKVIGEPKPKSLVELLRENGMAI